MGPHGKGRGDDVAQPRARVRRARTKARSGCVGGLGEIPIASEGVEGLQVKEYGDLSAAADALLIYQALQFVSPRVQGCLPYSSCGADGSGNC